MCQRCNSVCTVVKKNYLCQRCFEQTALWPVCPVHQLRPATRARSQSRAAPQPTPMPPGLPAVPAPPAPPARSARFDGPPAAEPPAAPGTPGGLQNMWEVIFGLLGRVAQLEQQLQGVLTTMAFMQSQLASPTQRVQFQASTRPSPSSSSSVADGVQAEAAQAVQAEPAAVHAEPAAAGPDGLAPASGSVHDSESSTEFTHC